MSANINIPGVVNPPSHWRLTTTDITDIYTALDNLDVVLGFIIVNETTSTVTCMLDRWDGITNNHFYYKAIPASDTVTLADMTVRLRSGDIIRATAGASNSITVNLNVVKVAGRSTA